MLSKSDLAVLRRFVSTQRQSETSPLERLWAGRCAALLAELQQLEQQVDELTREPDPVLESKASDTWVA